MLLPSPLCLDRQCRGHARHGASRDASGRHVGRQCRACRKGQSAECPTSPPSPQRTKVYLKRAGQRPPPPPPPLRAATYLDGGGGKAPTTLAVPGTSAMVSASASSQCAALTPDDEQGSNRQAPVATADAPTGGVGGQRKEGADATGVRRPSRKPEHAVQARAVK